MRLLLLNVVVILFYSLDTFVDANGLCATCTYCAYCPGRTTYQRVPVYGRMKKFRKIHQERPVVQQYVQNRPIHDTAYRRLILNKSIRPDPSQGYGGPSSYASYDNFNGISSGYALPPGPPPPPPAASTQHAFNRPYTSYSSLPRPSSFPSPPDAYKIMPVEEPLPSYGSSYSAGQPPLPAVPLGPPTYPQSGPPQLPEPTYSLPSAPPTYREPSVPAAVPQPSYARPLGPALPQPSFQQQQQLGPPPLPPAPPQPEDFTGGYGRRHF